MCDFGCNLKCSSLTFTPLVYYKFVNVGKKKYLYPYEKCFF